MIKAIVIDDEKNCRESLVKLLHHYFKDVDVVAEADSSKSGIEKIKEWNPDVVFLDIEMPHGSGFEVLKSFKQINFEVIFTTAYNHYAIKAIKFSALDYLLKPIDIDELEIAIKRYKEKYGKVDKSEGVKLLLDNLGDEPNKLNKIALPDVNGFEVVNIENIIYCEADRNYTKIYLQGENLPKITSKSLMEYDKLLQDNNFCRIHQSYLININHVEKYIKGRSGNVVMTNKAILDISRSKRDDFLKLFTK